MLALLTIYPKDSLAAAVNGINLWIFVVIPSLFPFFIVSDLLISLKVPENIARLFSPAARILFNTSGYGAYVFVMSIFSGYPAGAKITSQLIETGKISSREGEKILTFSSTSGPLFIIGAVGAGMLGSTSAGYLLFASHVLGAVFNGMFQKFFYKQNSDSLNIKYSDVGKAPAKGDILSAAISNSLYISGFIGGYIILFSVIITLLDKVSIFNYLAGFLNIFMTHNLSMILSNICRTLLEISNGCKIISEMAMGFDLKLIAISFIIAFSGFSIIGQVASVTRKTKINLGRYILSKLTHGIFSALICCGMLKMNLFSIQTFSTKPFNLMNTEIILLETLLFIIMLLNIESFIKRKVN
jgi:sporulation integral membrane protein YlbJ